jgi:hypothetical protein
VQHIIENPSPPKGVARASETVQLGSANRSQISPEALENQAAAEPKYSLRDQLQTLIPSFDPASYGARETLVNANRIFNLRLNNAYEWPSAATRANMLGAHISGSLAYRHAPLADLEKAAKFCQWLAKGAVVIAELEDKYGLQ